MPAPALPAPAQFPPAPAQFPPALERALAPAASFEAAAQRRAARRRRSAPPLGAAGENPLTQRLECRQRARRRLLRLLGLPRPSCGRARRSPPAATPPRRPCRRSGHAGAVQLRGQSARRRPQIETFARRVSAPEKLIPRNREALRTPASAAVTDRHATNLVRGSRHGRVLRMPSLRPRRAQERRVRRVAVSRRRRCTPARNSAWVRMRGGLSCGDVPPMRGATRIAGRAGESDLPREREAARNAKTGNGASKHPVIFFTPRPRERCNNDEPPSILRRSCPARATARSRSSFPMRALRLPARR